MTKRDQTQTARAALQIAQVRAYVELDDRELEELRKLAPYPDGWNSHWTTRLGHLLWSFEGRGLPTDLLIRAEKLAPGFLGCGYNQCVYCGRQNCKNRVLAVDPISLARSYYRVCHGACYKKLRTWEGRAAARARRAQYDWERQNPEVAPLALIADIPPQYPSVSRATLRAFIDSGEDVATVENGTNPTALNSSIKSLGFGDRVYAEVRSGQTVLRRVPQEVKK